MEMRKSGLETPGLEARTERIHFGLKGCAEPAKVLKNTQESFPQLVTELSWTTEGLDYFPHPGRRGLFTR